MRGQEIIFNQKFKILNIIRYGTVYEYRYRVQQYARKGLTLSRENIYRLHCTYIALYYVLRVYERISNAVYWHR
jgi:hypothetical protein